MIDELSPSARKVLVKRCVEDMISSAQQSPDFIRDIAMGGVKGFDNLTDKELIQAYIDAGLDEKYSDNAHQNFQEKEEFARARQFLQSGLSYVVQNLGSWEDLPFSIFERLIDDVSLGHVDEVSNGYITVFKDYHGDVKIAHGGLGTLIEGNGPSHKLFEDLAFELNDVDDREMSSAETKAADLLVNLGYGCWKELVGASVFQRVEI